METVFVRSKSTGLVGEYPASHLALDDDLELVSADDAICVDCVIEPETATETETRKGRKNG